MKKVIFAVICGLFLVGCAKNEPKPYAKLPSSWHARCDA